MARGTKKPARRTSKAKSEESKKLQKRAAGRAVHKLDARFREWRYTGKGTPRDYVEVTAVSLAGVLGGAGIWINLMWEPTRAGQSYGLFMVAASVLAVVAYMLFGRGTPKQVTVGDLGVGGSQGGRIARTPWYRIDTLTLVGERLHIAIADAERIDVSLASHRSAAARLVAEALRRIPERVDLDEAQLEAVGSPSKTEGERVQVAPPQVTGERCRASDKALSFENDVRMCSRCGVLYHRTKVPARCLECRSSLRG